MGTVTSLKGGYFAYDTDPQRSAPYKNCYTEAT